MTQKRRNKDASVLEKYAGQMTERSYGVPQEKDDYGQRKYIYGWNMAISEVINNMRRAAKELRTPIKENPWGW